MNYLIANGDLYTNRTAQSNPTTSDGEEPGHRGSDGVTCEDGYPAFFIMVV